MSFFWPQTIVTVKGKISPRLDVVFENGQKVLNAGHVNYSFGNLHTVFQFAMKQARVKEDPPHNMLILGFGAGSIASIVRNEMKIDLKITGVEADEEVIRIAEEFFGMKNFPGLQLVYARAEEFIQTVAEKFDLICVDVFVEGIVPEECRTDKFLLALKSALNSNGKIIFNVMPRENRSGGDELADLFGKVFPANKVEEINLGNSPNRILIGFKN
ncbi:MAG: hypothetical protein HY064_11170 [Bacteroidetes bacterium]|nr:hypothetical protein [Bacteroidota bacterium]